MARGWESKSVEDQIAAAEAAKMSAAQPESSPAERARQARRNVLALARARILQDLETATDPRYHAMLDASLAHVDAELAALD